MTSQTYWLHEKAQVEVRKYLEKTVGIGRTDGHYKLKTSDRGANPKHCREVVQLAMGLGEEGMKAIRGKYGKSTKQLLEVATGRPRKKGRISDTHLAGESAGNILRDLRKAAGKGVGAVSYKPGRIKSPESPEVLKALIEQADGFHAEFEAEIEAAAKPVKKATRKRAPRTRKASVKKTA